MHGQWALSGTSRSCRARVEPRASQVSVEVLRKSDRSQAAVGLGVDTSKKKMGEGRGRALRITEDTKEHRASWAKSKLVTSQAVESCGRRLMPSKIPTRCLATSLLVNAEAPSTWLSSNSSACAPITCLQIVAVDRVSDPNDVHCFPPIVPSSPA